MLIFRFGWFTVKANTQQHTYGDCSNNIDTDGNPVNYFKRVHASEMMITVVDDNAVYIMGMHLYDTVRLLLEDSVRVCTYYREMLPIYRIDMLYG
jgi:hypothetical protein